MPLNNSPAPGHVRIVDFLRGLAALMVVVFHFGCGCLSSLKGLSLNDWFCFGQFGVYVFFVISGFIIPYALYHSGYNSGQFFRHVFRRIVRIDPPAYVSVLLLFAFYYAALLITGSPIMEMKWPGINVAAIFANLTYTVDFLDTSWYNQVFWTLAIEFQFYLLVGLLLPVLTKGHTFTTAITLVAILLLFYIPINSFLRHGSFFVMGIVLFLEREKLLKTFPAIVLLLFATLCCLVLRGPVQMGFALFTVVMIRFASFSTRVTDHLAKISFSLYLTHLFAGWSAEIFVRKFIFIPDTEFEKVFLFVVFVLWAIVFATVYYKYVELPFVNLSKRIKWKRNERVVEPEVQIGTVETVGPA